MFITSIATTVVAGVSWGVAIAGIWANIDSRVLPPDRAVAVASTGAAVLLWVARYCVRDHVLCYMLEKAVSQRVKSRYPAHTEPLRAVR